MKTLTAFYDLEHGPVSYDFVTWLVRAMRERDARRCDRLHAVIVPKEDGLGGFSRHWGKHDEAAARWRLWHICVMACPLAGATATVAASLDQARDMLSSAHSRGDSWREPGKAHFMGPLVEAARSGETIPLLRATEAARKYVASWIGKSAQGRAVVTMTVRDQQTDPARNSNMDAWVALHRAAMERGFHPVWLDDSHIALGNGNGYAELDPDLRLALYEQSAMNFIGNNGPQELLKFSAAPYRIVGLGLESWREHFRKYFSMEFGEQLPWATKDQKLVYEPDSLDVLKREFELWA